MVAGCQVTVRDGGHVVVLALRDGDAIVAVETLSAPRAEAEADALAGLRVRVRDVLRDQAVTSLALWHYEGTPGGVKINAARPVVRAEGVVLAAAGEIGVRASEVSANSERRKGKFKKNDELVRALVSPLSGVWGIDAGRAVAASTFA